MERLCVDTYPGLAATPLKRGRATRDHDSLQGMDTKGMQRHAAAVFGGSKFGNFHTQHKEDVLRRFDRIASHIPIQESHDPDANSIHLPVALNIV